MSADNCVSIETAKRESVNTGLSAIITRDMVDIDLALDVQDSDTGSSKYQHNDLATGSDAHLVLTTTDGSISTFADLDRGEKLGIGNRQILQCNSCEWATDLLEPSKARQNMKAQTF